MNLYVRLLLTLLASLLRDRLHHEQAAETHFRVLPNDLDAFGHMNNGRYLQIMDVARIDWMLRTGVAAGIRRNRWAPVLGGGFIRFRHSLRLLQRYRVRTRLLAWDDRWFYHEHAFVDRRERCVAVGVTRAALRSQGEWVLARDVVATIKPGAESPAVPDFLARWVGLEKEMFRFGSAGANPGPELPRIRGGRQ